jgi:excinuclease UvrABC nuclease subunit
MEDIPHVLHELENKMEIAAANLQFEEAAKFRDEVAALKKRYSRKR